jgi:hypothetical protein
MKLEGGGLVHELPTKQRAFQRSRHSRGRLPSTAAKTAKTASSATVGVYSGRCNTPAVKSFHSLFVLKMARRPVRGGSVVAAVSHTPAWWCYLFFAKKEPLIPGCRRCAMRPRLRRRRHQMAQTRLGWRRHYLRSLGFQDCRSAPSSRGASAWVGEYTAAFAETRVGFGNCGKGKAF